jgi:hypothetical protein
MEKSLENVRGIMQHFINIKVKKLLHGDNRSFTFWDILLFMFLGMAFIKWDIDGQCAMKDILANVFSWIVCRVDLIMVSFTTAYQ